MKTRLLYIVYMVHNHKQGHCWPLLTYLGYGLSVILLYSNMTGEANNTDHADTIAHMNI